MKDVKIVILAVNKGSIIPDQLLKRLDGVTLIQRAINTCFELVPPTNVLILTDSEELSLIASRNNVEFIKDASLSSDQQELLSRVNQILETSEFRGLIIYEANTPLINADDLKDAYRSFAQDPSLPMVSVSKRSKKILRPSGQGSLTLSSPSESSAYELLNSFQIFPKEQMTLEHGARPYVLSEEKSVEIENYQSWWICEKILQRKKIVFNVIGNKTIGMGHIYHSLALAHEITNHEIYFVCDEKYELAVEKIAAKDYKVMAVPNPLEAILDLKPDLVINDMLNTEEEYIKVLKKHGIHVVNFEDLGPGAEHADMVFNEVYDTPLKEGDHYHWGHEYISLRDEFDEAIPHAQSVAPKSFLITFGGTDQHNLSSITLDATLSIAKEYSMTVHIVCGAGYAHIDALQRQIASSDYDQIIFTHASGIISKVMEETSIGISANGRTVYELAHMNIPSLVISHHEREHTHGFASLDKGFINLGIYDPETTPEKIRNAFSKLVRDDEYRHLLFLNMKKYDFKNNKRRVVHLIQELLD